ncbi:highly divergent homeobox [Gracilinanus agilis]|uniref:highly divergent homeobox n=1 Tax=Gracilinanus agilis TaxID=191870 RepID=UPI001CFE3A06|nr:highly divergent homeobox [Gracilinanus agilis]
MNLRSVFTVEQQRILQRYYENGMTNQSKNCFQLILQCAQETKLDFSVVRTWVGNKRRKMSSKNAESGSSTPGTIPGTPQASPDIAVRNIVSVNATRPPSQQSSWATSNNDVIVTGIYSPASSSSRQGSTKQTNVQMAETHKIPIQRALGKNEPEFQLHVPVQRQMAHCKNASLLLGEKTIILSRQTSVLNAGNPAYNQAKKNYGGASVQAAEMPLPQKSTACHRPCKTEPGGGQRSYKPEHSSLMPHSSSGQRGSARDPYCSAQNLEIREVFSLAVSDYPQKMLGGNTSHKPSSAEGNYLSIAMETGDVDDEYAREEELALMGAQIPNYSRFYEGGSLRAENQSATLPGPGRNMANSQLVNARDLPDNVLYHRDYHLAPRTSLHTPSSTLYSSANPSRSNFSPHFVSSNQLRLSQNQNNYQISGNLTVPWITGCSRKRALQDRTQFSDRDLATLKKYWDNGMTSLGSVCREKIEAVAAELNVDCEIVRTWIGNRRRKYRLMGIEVPPPRGGPADFSEQPESGPLSALASGEEAGPEVVEDNDRNDEVSICLSEGSSQEEPSEAVPNEASRHKEEDPSAVSTDNVKIEIIDDEESDMISNSEVEQMSSLLDYKNEEVRFMENELEIQKQKYFKLQAFVRSLILAMKADDKEQQQALLSDLPPELEELDFHHTSPEPDDTSFSLSSLSEKNASDSL